MSNCGHDILDFEPEELFLGYDGDMTFDFNAFLRTPAPIQTPESVASEAALYNKREGKKVANKADVNEDDVDNDGGDGGEGAAYGNNGDEFFGMFGGQFSASHPAVAASDVDFDEWLNFDEADDDSEGEAGDDEVDDDDDDEEGDNDEDVEGDDNDDNDDVDDQDDELSSRLLPIDKTDIVRRKLFHSGLTKQQILEREAEEREDGHKKADWRLATREGIRARVTVLQKGKKSAIDYAGFIFKIKVELGIDLSRAYDVSSRLFCSFLPFCALYFALVLFFLDSSSQHQCFASFGGLASVADRCRVTRCREPKAELYQVFATLVESAITALPFPSACSIYPLICLSFCLAYSTNLPPSLRRTPHGSSPPPVHASPTYPDLSSAP